MNSSQRVATNSLWLVVQPLILNIASILVIGYMARVLGQTDYGKFTFAFTFVAMLAPLSNMGLRAVTVREIAQDRRHADSFLGKMLVARLALSAATVLVCATVVNVIGYPADTKLVVYIAATTIVFQALASTIHDAFQAFETTRYMAYAQFLSGAIMTGMCVVVLASGGRLVTLTSVYALGALLSLLFSYGYLKRNVTRPRYSVELSLWRENLVKGAPFFFPTLVALVGNKLGIVLLSAISGDAAVGIYGAANVLVEKLIIIPDGICTAMYPAMIVLFRQSPEEAGQLYRRFYLYLILIGLPIAAGTTVLARPIVHLVYGPQYEGSVAVLQLLIWWLFLTFLTWIQSWTLAAIHCERKAGLAAVIATGCYLLLSVLLIPALQERGAAAAALVSAGVCFGVLTWYIRHNFVKHTIRWRTMLTCLLATGVVVGAATMMRRQSIFVAVPVCAVLYAGSVLALGLVSWSELTSLRRRSATVEGVS